MADVTIENLPLANVIVPSVDVLPLVTGTGTLITKKATANEVVASILETDPLFSVSAVATGTLPDGSTVIINTNGTVSAVTGNAAVVGSDIVFSGSCVNLQACWITESNVIAIVYQSTVDDTIQIYSGQVSGTTINFNYAGPVTLATGAPDGGTFPTICTYYGSSLVIVSYSPVSDNQLYVVGVEIDSGANITDVGTPVLVDSTYTTNQAVSDSYFALLNVFDGAFFIAYQTTDGGIRAASVTAFGTSLTLSGSYQLSTSTYTPDITLGYYSPYLVAFYQNGSGAGITIGTFNGSTLTAINTINLTGFNLTQNTFASVLRSDGSLLVAFAEVNTGVLDAVVISINYTTFTATILNRQLIDTSPAVGRNAIAIYQYPNGTADIFYEVTATGLLKAARIQVNAGGIIKVTDELELVQSAFSTALSVSPTGTDYQTVVFFESSSDGQNFLIYNAANTNMTDTNFIGFSYGDYTNGQTAIVKTIGSAIAGLSGLVTGSHYYVTETGALSTTPGNPTVNAGTAISTTALTMNG